MLSPFLDDIDREAMREGDAISRLKAYACAKERKVKCARTQKGKPEDDPNILRILNIIHEPKQAQDRGHTPLS